MMLDKLVEDMTSGNDLLYSYSDTWLRSAAFMAVSAGQSMPKNHAYPGFDVGLFRKRASVCCLYSYMRSPNTGVFQADAAV